MESEKICISIGLFCCSSLGNHGSTHQGLTRRAEPQAGVVPQRIRKVGRIFPVCQAYGLSQMYPHVAPMFDPLTALGSHPTVPLTPLRQDLQYLPDPLREGLQYLPDPPAWRIFEEPQTASRAGPSRGPSKKHHDKKMSPTLTPHVDRGRHPPDPRSWRPVSLTCPEGRPSQPCRDHHPPPGASGSSLGAAARARRAAPSAPSPATRPSAEAPRRARAGAPPSVPSEITVTPVHRWKKAVAPGGTKHVVVCFQRVRRLCGET